MTMSAYPGWDHLVSWNDAPICPRCGEQSGYDWEIRRCICPTCGILTDDPPDQRATAEKPD
jgi:hypothetical protein